MINHHAITSSIAYQRRADLERQAQRARLARSLRCNGRRRASAPTRRLRAGAGAPHVAAAS
jgi:hypothetical protein